MLENTIYILRVLHTSRKWEICGDSLSMRYNEVLYTPFFFLGDFKQKLEDRAKINNTQEAVSEATAVNTGSQLKLFKFL